MEARASSLLWLARLIVECFLHEVAGQVCHRSYLVTLLPLSITSKCESQGYTIHVQNYLRWNAKNCRADWGDSNGGKMTDCAVSRKDQNWSLLVGRRESVEVNGARLSFPAKPQFLPKRDALRPVAAEPHSRDGHGFRDPSSEAGSNILEELGGLGRIDPLSASSLQRPRLSGVLR